MMVPLQREWKLIVLGLALILPVGCGSENPDSRIEAPIITDDAPQSSEEAAAQSEPTEPYATP